MKEKMPFIKRIKYFIAAIAFKIFLWGDETTEDIYFNEIYQSEEARRKPRRWSDRRNGKTSILIADAVQKLIETGTCVYREEYAEHVNHAYYSKHVIPKIYDALFGILRRRDVKKIFKHTFVYDRNRQLEGVKFFSTESQIYL